MTAEKRRRSKLADLDVRVNVAMYQMAIGERKEGKKSRGRVKFSDMADEGLSLYAKMETGDPTAHDLVRLSFLMGMTTSEQYAEFLEV